MRARRHLTTLALLLTAGGLFGCVTSHSKSYQEHLSAVLPTEQFASEEVAVAFGLNEESRAGLALGRSEE